ncbi:MAG: hypothetical protein ACE5HO_08495, partial [bacterium]
MNTNKYFLMPLLLFLIDLSVPAFSQLSQELTPRYESILELKGEEKYTLAIARCKELVSDYPLYSKAYKQLVELSKLQNSLTLTQTYLKDLETEQADNPYIDYSLGLILEDREEYEKALKNFQKCITLVPNFADAYSDYAFVCKKLNRTKAALDFLREKSKQKAKSYGLAYGLGYLYFTQYQWDGALNHTAQALLLRPDFWQAYQLKYRIYD